MRTVFGMDTELKPQKGTAVTIGNFDGVHLGHQTLLLRLKQKAQQENLSTVVYTFRTHPLNILRGENAVSLIYDADDKAQLFSGFDIDTLIFEDFIKIKDLAPEEFVKKVLVDKLHVKLAVIGENNRFGKHSAGDASLLCRLGKEYGFSVEVIPSLCIDGVVCSSSEIRNCIAAGEVEKASRLLGRPYRIAGEVVGGKQLGRTYGFPTANLIPKKGLVLPKYGVYATNAWVDGNVYPAITNVGETSFDKVRIERIETNLIGFDKDIYGNRLELDFLGYMRGFVKFHSVEQLEEQLKTDRETRLKLTEEER